MTANNNYDYLILTCINFNPTATIYYTSRSVLEGIQQKWSGLRGRSQAECVRISLTCLRKWQHFGAALFPAAMPPLPPPPQLSGEATSPDSPASPPPTPLWVAVSEDAISLLEHGNMNPIARYI